MTNIGGIYDKSFKILFFCTIIELTISFFAYSISKQTADVHAEPVYRLAIFFYALASLAECAIWIYLFINRFSHAGQVCSGDFLSNKEAPEGYCPAQGRFILVVAAIFVAMCLCSVFVIPIVVICLSIIIQLFFTILRLKTKYNRVKV